MLSNLLMEHQLASALSLEEELICLKPGDPAYASQFVERLLAGGRRYRISDIHLQPVPSGLDIRWRLDGVLQPLGRFPAGANSDIIARLKVLAGLLTYRNDVPQEGRIRSEPAGVEMRVSTFPTLYGERAVVRIFAEADELLQLGDLQLPEDIVAELDRLLTAPSGALLVTGPAGSGKTTSAYACLRGIAHRSGGGKSLVTLEDPIEVALEGVVQSQVRPAVGFDLAAGLRALMRQDPEVILVGEIRDRETAENVFQAALTGHLVLTTMHAGSAAEAIGRLADMGIEPYLLRSGVLGVLHQRLVRRLCECAQSTDDDDRRLALPVSQAWQARGCAACAHTGYLRRMPLAELLLPDHLRAHGRQTVLTDARRLERAAMEAGLKTVWARAIRLVESGATSPEEVRRVLGIADREEHRRA